VLVCLLDADGCGAFLFCWHAVPASPLADDAQPSASPSQSRIAARREGEEKAASFRFFHSVLRVPSPRREEDEEGEAGARHGA
jgi:hypothetical protein